jgi:F-type H+-transporting ATPase subunit b
MLIDWFTVGAQLLNFLILVWLLKRFLYKPILDGIDAREKHIAAELADAAAKQTAADKERDEFFRRSKALEDQRGALLSKAAEEANTEREDLLAQARKEADGLRVQQQNAMRDDQVTLGREMTRLAQGEVFAIARKALADLAAASLEERMGEVFTRRLREIDGKAKESLAAAVKTLTGPAVVRSAFEMAVSERSAIPSRFETAPGAVCGIELTVKGQRLAWDIAEYLAGMQQNLESRLAAEVSPAPAT